MRVSSFEPPIHQGTYGNIYKGTRRRRCGLTAYTRRAEKYVHSDIDHTVARLRTVDKLHRVRRHRARKLSCLPAVVLKPTNATNKQHFSAADNNLISASSMATPRMTRASARIAAKVDPTAGACRDCPEKSFRTPFETVLSSMPGVYIPDKKLSPRFLYLPTCIVLFIVTIYRVRCFRRASGEHA